ncbi:MAG: alpha/beta hydrolase [Burkholderiales bacterium]|nr:alpha/beta hydrolase [Burkholderiales bacterium]
MQLTPWTHTACEGFVLRGWHSPPSGKPLLHFLHGNGFCGRVYTPMLAPLSEHFDLWLSDVQGHGDSDHGDRFVGWNRSADLAAEAFTAHLPLFSDVPRSAMGHSFGGVLTCLTLAQHPQLFERAVVLDPVLFSPAMLWAMTMAQWTGLSGHHPLARSARARRQHWPDRAEAKSSLEGRGTYRGWTDESLQAFVDHALREAPEGGISLKCAPQRESEIFSSAPQGLWSALSRITTPTLMLHGERTFPFVTASARQWQLINPHVESLQVSGGHCFMQEDPIRTAAHANAFLSP